MADYKQSTFVGTTWQRCHQIVIDNPRRALPAARFDEEEVLLLADGKEIKRSVGSVRVPFDPAQEIPLRNPTSGALTGATATYGDAYALLYSAYIAAAEARDAALVPPPAP
jgi:hypothetical protein